MSKEKDMYTIHLDGDNDWAELLQDETVIYRGHVTETYEALAELVAVIEYVPVVGPRLDAIDQIGGIHGG